MDGIGTTADEEPHFVVKPVEDKGPDIPDTDEEAMKEIEKEVDEKKDVDPGTDIGEIISKNPDIAKKALNKKKKPSKTDPTCPPVEEKDKVHVVVNDGPECSTLSETEKSAWNIADGMLIEDDFKDDHLTIVFFTLTGEFDVPEEPSDDVEPPSITAKLVSDDVE